MGVGGEVEAVLTVRDNMSAAVQAATQRVADLNSQLATLGVTSGPVFNALQARALEAQQSLDRLKEVSAGAATGIQIVGEKADTTGGQLGQMDRLATRMVERLLIFYALKETFSFTIGLFEAADAIVAVSDRLDLSILLLEKWQEAGDRAGVSTQQQTNSLDKLVRTLSDVKASSEDALESIGLSFSQLFAMSPDDRIIAIARAIEALPSPLDRVEAEVKLFGTDAVDPLLKNFAAMTDSGQLATAKVTADHERMLANTVQMYRNMGEGAKGFFSNILAGWNELVAVGAAPLFGATQQQSFQSLHSQSGTGGTKDSGPTPLMGQDYIESLRKQAIAVKGLTDEQKIELQELRDLNLLTADHAAHLGLDTEQFKQYETQVKAADAITRQHAQAYKLWQQAAVEVNSAGTDYKTTLEGIDGATVAAIKSGLEAGVSQHTLAVYYDQTATVVRAAANELRAETEAKRVGARATADITLAITRLRDEEADLKVKLSGSTTDIIIANERRISDNQAAQMKKRGEDTREYENERTDRDNLFTQVAIHNEELRDTNSRASFQQRLADATAEYRFKIEHSDQYTAIDIANSKRRMDQARLEAANWRSVAIANIQSNLDEAKSVETLAGEWITAAEAKARYNSGNSITYDLSTPEGMDYFRSLNPGATIANVPPDYFKSHSLQQAIQAGIINLYGAYQQQNRPPGFADGGDITVGERGPEIIRIFPSGTSPGSPGSGGGRAVTIGPIYLNGTPEEGANKFSRILIDQVFSGRLLGTT